MIFSAFKVLENHRGLIFHLIRQEIRVTYARSWLGLYWIVLLPILYVGVMIGVRFFALGRGASQWIPGATAPETTAWQALAIVLGLLVFWLAAETLNRGPGSVRKHSSLVTDLKFPVEVLPWITVGLSVFNFSVRLLLMVAAHCVFIGLPPWEMLLVPLAVLPLASIMVGITYLFSAIGVFITDLEYVVQILMTALLLLSGVMFPLEIVPEPYRSWLYLNPIAFAIREARTLGLYGEQANWLWLVATLVLGFVVSAFGYWVFQRLRPRFSDAL